MRPRAAHIVTAEAVALGDPEVIVMAVEEEGEAGQLIGRYPVPDGDLETALKTLSVNGWRVVGGRVDVEPGYHIIDIERM